MQYDLLNDILWAIGYNSLLLLHDLHMITYTLQQPIQCQKERLLYLIPYKQF